ncbi:MAG TPA: hypothetical protein VJ992_11485 [Gemmatimonadales bacterium]|nr:hypothetical protein [Gemmatimonadales bacterium]
MGPRAVAFVAGLAWCAGPATLVAQNRDWSTLPTGRIIERVTSPSDTTEHYALYLPRAYPAGRTWPVLVLLDPRGRALVPLERVRASAERLGYLVVSSYNTASDGPAAPNERAFQAILRDLLPRLAIDRRRFYFAGMSGTARQAWEFAYRLPGTAAGVIGFSAGLPVSLDSLVAIYGEQPRFAFFGGAGRLDFNYQELRALDATLDHAGTAHRVVFYAGPHGWPPASVFDAALTWLEWEAVREGWSSADSTALESAYAAALDSAHARDTRTPLASDVRAEMDRLGKEEAAYRRRVFETAGAIRRAAHRDDPAPWLERLQVAKLLRVAGATDTLAAEAAYRELALAFTEFSFYESRTLESAGDDARALLVLQIADGIRPGTPQVCARIAALARRLGRDVACRAPTPS